MFYVFLEHTKNVRIFFGQRCILKVFFLHWPGIRCLAKTRRGTKCQSAAYKHNGRCILQWRTIDRRASAPEGLQRTSEANIEHGLQTKDKLEAQRHAAKVGRRVLGELKRIEGQLVDAGLMPDGD